MRHTTRAPIRLGVEALDEQDLLGREPVLVVEAVLGVVRDAQSLAATIRIDEADGHEVGLGHRRGVGHGQGVPKHGLDGPPDVDDLHAAPEERVGFLGQVVRHPGQRRAVRLVDVHALDGAADWGWCGAGGGGFRLFAVGPRVGYFASDGVVEDEDLGCARTRRKGSA